MSWNNSGLSWSEMERRLSGRPGRLVADVSSPPVVEVPDRPAADVPGPLARDAAEQERVVDPLATDSPAPTRNRPQYQALPWDTDGLGAPPAPAGGAVPYAELHCHTNFSFLDGASHPEELAEEAVRLGLTGLAVTDHDGLYGVVRFAEATRDLNQILERAGRPGLRTIFGAELSLGDAPSAYQPVPVRPSARPGAADPPGRHLLVLARGPEGYARLSRTIAEAHLAGGEKGRPAYHLEQVAADLAGHVLVLTGCRKGLVPAALRAEGVDAAARELDRLVALFGAEHVAVELTNQGDPRDDERNDALDALAAGLRPGPRGRRLPTVATNNVHYATPGRRRLATALAAVRARRSLDEMDGWLPAAATAHLRGGVEMAARFTAYPASVARAAAYGEELGFDLTVVAPKLPDYPVPAGHTEMSWLRKLTMDGALERYGPREAVRDVYAQLDHELKMIDELGFPGYFLVVYDIVRYCREHDIYCQGRGSAANSAVCYALRITNVDAVAHRLLFERFLAPERDGPPDIDVDIESGRREEVIQYVYGKYDRRHTAQVANVISYRPRSAVRDIARAFGFSPGQQDAWSKQIDRWGSVAVVDGREAKAGGGVDGWDAKAGGEVIPEGIPEHVIAYANELQTFPRHLGIHSGGMVICDRPVVEVCPVEWARMPGRTVLQWDKDDCAAAGLVKFDLLGLGMLTALHYARDMLDIDLDLSSLDLDDGEVYDMLCRADSVGVFQVESRAQMATLPRLKPREFYDLVVEVALIRPGPIQGGSVHPYIRRKNGQEKWNYPHPLMRNALAKTMGVPLFQEQLMQLAIDVAGFDPAEADRLRRAMGSKRSTRRMAELRERLYAGMAERGITGELADDIFLKLSAFANYGFPESHAISFAYLVYASAWLKRYHPAAFCAALLNAQPMGFYSPQSLVEDARRHGVEVRRPDINASDAKAVLESTRVTRWGSEPGEPPHQWGLGGPAVRMGLSSVRTFGDDLAQHVEDERRAHGPYRDMPDVARRAGLSTAHLEALATADAFGCFGLTRREALWAAGAAAQERPVRRVSEPGHRAVRRAHEPDQYVQPLPGTANGTMAPVLPGMDEVETLVADVWATGLSPDRHPAQFIRDQLARAGAVPIAKLPQIEHGRRVVVGGIVTHRQRPATAGGITFMNLEDETGMLNVTCSPGLWQRYRRVARTSPALLVRGRLEKYEGVINLTADRLEAVTPPVRAPSRDFR